MSTFSVDWLDLREVADQRARDAGLLHKAKQACSVAISDKGDAFVVDLGSGTGSTLRAFSAPLKNAVDRFSWQLVDQDEVLLQEAKRRHGNSHRITTLTVDLNRIDCLPLSGANLVTASALFDLVSAPFIDRLVTELTARSPIEQPAFYAALNYDGTTAWTPEHPMDAPVLQAFNRDQLQDKGFGPALGPAAVSYLERSFRAAGYAVATADSPWILDGHDQPLVAALISGIAEAVVHSPELSESAVEAWMQFRLSHAADGTCTVGHTDLLARPPASS